jgi:hypothetical protein
MAKSKTLPKLKDLRAHLFMSVVGNHVDIVYHDDAENGAGLGAGLSSLMEQDAKLFDIFSAAFLTTLEAKEKYSSKKSNKLPKTPTKAVKKK